jgi:hypothetical protein
MKIKSKVVSSLDAGFFEREIEKFYEEYVGYDISIQFCPQTNNRDVLLVALLIAKGRSGINGEE